MLALAAIGMLVALFVVVVITALAAWAALRESA